VQSPQEQFGEYLRRHGQKFTHERRRVLDEIDRQQDHFQADELLSAMRKRKVKVSKATLYRTLALLVRAGLLREEVFGERHLHYERIFGQKHHDHLVCLACGKIEEFRNDEIEDAQEAICKQHGFLPTGHRMEIHGYCRECRRGRRETAQTSNIEH